MKNLLLIDGFAMMFRAFYAVKFAPQHQGQPLNAVYGCATTLMQLIESQNATQIVLAFDRPEKTFRHELDPNYKAQRVEAPDEFCSQIPLVWELVKAFELPLLTKPGFEADDIIGTLAVQASREINWQAQIISGDLDFLQLMGSQISLSRFRAGQIEAFDREKTYEKLGVYPEQVIDFKAICGDSSDNYKGISGIGAKTAANLLGKYQTLQGIYDHLDELTPTQQKKFIQDQDNAWHCQRLATIATDVEIDYDFTKSPNYHYPGSNVADFLESISLNSLSKRAFNLNKKSDQKENPEPKNSSNQTRPNSTQDQMSLF